jgi:hypothetical protein
VRATRLRGVFRLRYHSLRRSCRSLRTLRPNPLRLLPLLPPQGLARQEACKRAKHPQQTICRVRPRFRIVLLPHASTENLCSKSRPFRLRRRVNSRSQAMNQRLKYSGKSEQYWTCSVFATLALCRDENQASNQRPAAFRALSYLRCRYQRTLPTDFRVPA